MQGTFSNTDKKCNKAWVICRSAPRLAIASAAAAGNLQPGPQIFHKPWQIVCHRSQAYRGNHRATSFQMHNVTLEFGEYPIRGNTQVTCKQND